MNSNKTVDLFILKNERWTTELQLLRNVMRSTGMEETIKWGAPVYVWKGKNVVGMAAFKSYVGLWFFQGVFLEDPAKVLQNAQDGKTKALRQWRFASAKEIDVELVRSYVLEAIANQEAGKEIKPAKPTRSKDVQIPDVLQQALNEDVELATAFTSFSPSHQREYAEYIAEAKRDETKQKRLEKIIPMIRNRAGLNDQYKK